MTRLPLILCYHKIEPRRELGVTRLSPRRFARQMEGLARRGWRTLTLAELVACVRSERPARPREMLISFDDAYRGLRQHAFPILREYGFRAVCSVVTAYAGRLNRWDVAYGGRRFAHLAWRDMRAWQPYGIEFVSHTDTHPRLTWLGASEVAVELQRSREALRRELDVDVACVTYPYGAARSREWNLAAQEGYSCGFGVGHAHSRNVMAIPRTPMHVWSPPPHRENPLPLMLVTRLAGEIASRCAVGTTIIRTLGHAK